MQQGRTRKILFAALLFSLSAIISSSYSNFNLNQKSSAFAQTPDPSTDPGAGPIPEDNSTDIGNGPIPEDNSTDNSISPPGLSDFDNLTSSGSPSEVTTIDNNATSQGSSTSAVPEFGSLATIIITISVIGVIVASKKARLHF